MNVKLKVMLMVALFGNFMIDVRGDDYPASQSGEIWGGSIDSIHAIRTQLTEILSKVPSGAQGKGSPWFTKLQEIGAQLDQVAASKTQTDLFAMVPNLTEIFQEPERPPFLSEAFGVLSNLGVDLITAAAAHVEQQNGTVTPGVLTKFVNIFASEDGFVSEPSWEDRAMPIDAPGVMILDPGAVVSQLKAGSWQDAVQFLGGGAAASEFFYRYTSSGNGLSVLKTKYATRRSVTDAEFNKLKAWVDQEERRAEGH